MEDYIPENKDALISVIKEERRNLDSLIEGLSIDQKLTPAVEASWTIKDIMAHIATWERLAYDRINSVLTGDSLKYPVIESDNFVDDFNAGTYEKYKDAEFGLVEQEYHTSHADLMDQIRPLDEDFIQGKLPFDWAGELTVLVFISANTHWHYQEHTSSIRKWLSEK